MIKIRKAEIGDYFSISELSLKGLGYEYSIEKTKEKLSCILNDNMQAVFVAVCDSSVVGYIHLENYDVLYADNYKNIMGIAVFSEYRRMGVGRALLQAAEKWAKANGAVGLRLCSGEEREAAHKFYIACGYTETKLQKNFKKLF